MEISVDINEDKVFDRVLRDLIGDARNGDIDWRRQDAEKRLREVLQQIAAVVGEPVVSGTEPPPERRFMTENERNFWRTMTCIAQTTIIANHECNALLYRTMMRNAQAALVEIRNAEAFMRHMASVYTWPP